MSKRHHASRRKSYGRRQHEVRERHDRGQQREGFEFELGDWGIDAPRPIRSPSSIRARPRLRFGSATDVAVYQGARPRTIAPAARRPRDRRGPDASGAGASAARSAPAAGRTASGLVLGAHRRRVRARLPLARPEVRVVGDGLRHRPARARARPARRTRPRPPLRPEPARPRAGRSASWRSTPASASSPRPSSCRPARRSSDAMLGRTDSRRRLLVLLVVFVVGSLAPRRAGSAYWQVVAARPARREAHRPRSPSGPRPRASAATIYDRSGTVVLATTVPRDRLVAASGQLTPDKRQRDGRRADPDPRPRRRRQRGAPRQARQRQDVRHPRAGSSPSVADQIRAALADQRVFAGSRSSPSPSGSTRRPAAGRDSTLARPAPRLRQPRRRRASTASSRPTRTRSPASRAWSSTPARRERPADPRDGDRVQPGVPGAGPPPDHRRRPPARGRAGAPGGLGRRQGQARLRGRAWTRTPARSTPRRPIRRTTPTTTRRSRRATRALHRPDRLDRLRARLGLQDDDRGRRPRAGHGDPSTRIKDIGTLRLDDGKTKIDDADRKGMGWMTFEDGVAYSRNVVAAKVALGLGRRRANRRRSCTRCGRGWASARRPASTSPARSAASSATRP